MRSVGKRSGFGALFQFEGNRRIESQGFVKGSHCVGEGSGLEYGAVDVDVDVEGGTFCWGVGS